LKNVFLLFVAVISISAFANTNCEVVVPGDYPPEKINLLLEANYTVITVPGVQTGWISFKNFEKTYVSEGRYAFSSTNVLTNILHLERPNKGGFNLYQKVNGSLKVVATQWSDNLTSEQIIRQFLPKCSDLP